jgi:hypothetical protein
VGPRTCLDDLERRKNLPLLRFELRPLDSPARSQSPRCTIKAINYPDIAVSFILLLTNYNIDGHYIP